MPNLNNKFTFDRFVVGPSNQFAYAAAIDVAQQPAKKYNPLFICGSTGLGKTHLLNAIGLMIMDSHPDLNVMYVSSEELFNELIDSIRYDQMTKFRDKYRNIDCLLIDEADFLAGKERTQEELLHIFNTLHDSGKQIVIAGDKFPKDIPYLQDKLRSRFLGGLIADIKLPEKGTRISVAKKMIKENNFSISDDIAHYIALHNMDDNIRAIEGSLIRINAYSSLTGVEINLDMVKEVLKTTKVNETFIEDKVQPHNLKLEPGSNNEITTADIPALQNFNDQLAILEKKIIKEVKALKESGRHRLDSPDEDFVTCFRVKIEIDYSIGEDDPAYNDERDNCIATSKRVGDDIMAYDDQDWNDMRNTELPLAHLKLCWLFHDLYDHANLSWKDILRIRKVYTHIIVYYGNDMDIKKELLDEKQQ